MDSRAPFKLLRLNREGDLERYATDIIEAPVVFETSTSNADWTRKLYVSKLQMLIKGH